MSVENNYFVRLSFNRDQVEKNLASAFRDLDIAKNVDILDVKFNYAYTALIKGGIALLSHRHLKIKSIPGHQAKIIEKVARALKDDSVEALGNMMRQKRNLDLYSGGIEVTKKECDEYLIFVGRVLKKLEKLIRRPGG